MILTHGLHREFPGVASGVSRVSTVGASVAVPVLASDMFAVSASGDEGVNITAEGMADG
jgi:hypothetical protein